MGQGAEGTVSFNLLPLIRKFFNISSPLSDSKYNCDDCSQSELSWEQLFVNKRSIRVALLQIELQSELVTSKLIFKKALVCKKWQRAPKVSMHYAFHKLLRKKKDFTARLGGSILRYNYNNEFCELQEHIALNFVHNDSIVEENQYVGIQREEIEGLERSTVFFLFECMQIFKDA